MNPKPRHLIRREENEKRYLNAILINIPDGLPIQPYADSTAMERDFGFTPKITLREGLRKFAEWYKEYYG